MSNAPRILVFAGSAREASSNKKLARVAAQMAQKAGAEVTHIDLRDYPMPLYDGDLEAASGLPEHAKTLKQLFIDHGGLFIAAPEYNSSLTPLLKNTIDWLSRAESSDEAGLVAYRGKVCALCSTSPGALGGLRGLVPLRMLLSNIGVHVVPDQLAVGGAMSAFTEAGDLADDAVAARLQGVANSLVAATRALCGGARNA
jgi:NAD(P)H-dependent FMN reductase